MSIVYLSNRIGEMGVTSMSFKRNPTLLRRFHVYSARILRSIRNNLPLRFVIKQLDDLAPFSKFIEGFLRFQCPHCHEIRATVNPKNNLAHCFCCQKNINNIDLMIVLGYDCKQAVSILKNWLHQYKTGNSTKAGNISLLYMPR